MVVAFRCSKYLNKSKTVQKSTRKQKKKMLMAHRQTRSSVLYPVSTAKRTKEAVETPAKKTEKKNQDEPYRDIFEFSKIVKILHFMSKDYKLSDSIGFSSSSMYRIVCVFDTVAGSNFIRADVLDQGLLDNIR